MAFEVFGLDPGVGSEQEALEVGRRDGNSGEERVRRLILVGEFDGGVRVLRKMVPAATEHL